MAEILSVQTQPCVPGPAGTEPGRLLQPPLLQGLSPQEAGRAPISTLTLPVGQLLWDADEEVRALESLSTRAGPQFLRLWGWAVEVLHTTDESPGPAESQSPAAVVGNPLASSVWARAQNICFWEPRQGHWKGQ